MVPIIDVKTVNKIGIHTSIVPITAKNLVRAPLLSIEKTSLTFKILLYINF